MQMLIALTDYLSLRVNDFLFPKFCEIIMPILDGVIDIRKENLLIDIVGSNYSDGFFQRSFSIYNDEVTNSLDTFNFDLWRISVLKKGKTIPEFDFLISYYLIYNQEYFSEKEKREIYRKNKLQRHNLLDQKLFTTVLDEKIKLDFQEYDYLLGRLEKKDKNYLFDKRELFEIIHQISPVLDDELLIHICDYLNVDFLKPDLVNLRIRSLDQQTQKELIKHLEKVYNLDFTTLNFPIEFSDVGDLINPLIGEIYSKLEI